MQRVARRDAQAVADVVSLDMARRLGAGVTPTDSMATDSAERSSGQTGRDAAVHVFTGYIPAAATHVSDQTLGCGSSPYNTYFTQPTATNPANAVLVTAGSTVDFSLRPGSGAVCRSAIAQTDATACYQLGSWAAKVNTGDSALLAQLNDVFGLNLTLAGYQGLAGANVTLAQLASTTQFGSTTALLANQTTYGNLVAATVAALSSQSPANAAAIGVLGSFTNVGANTPKITLGDILGVGPTDTAALATKMNVLDLLAGALLVAENTQTNDNGTVGHAVYIPNLWANVAGTGNTIGTTLAVTEGAFLRCGRPNTEATHGTTAQIRGAVKFNLIQSSSLNLGGGNTLQTEAATGSFDLNAAKADAQMVSPPAVHCGTGAADPTTFSVNVATALASAGLSIDVPVSGSVKVAYLSALGIPLGTITVALNFKVHLEMSTTVGASSARADLKIPPNDTTPVSVGGAPLSLTGLALMPTIDASTFTAKVTAGLLGIISVGTQLSLDASSLTSVLNGVLSNLTNTADSTSFASKTLLPLASNIDAGILGPLSKGLGIRLGGADVYGIGATCNVPVLRG
jgi:hypothetical protein